MTMGQIIPTANEPWFRKTMGWTLPPFMPMLKASRPPEERERAMRRQVYQDFAFPAEHLRELLLHLDETFEIYPLLVYPCRVIDRGGMMRLPGRHGAPWDGEARSALYLNLGIYGPPKAIREGDLRYPTVTEVRRLEAMIRERGGFLHTYVDVLRSPRWTLLKTTRPSSRRCSTTPYGARCARATAPKESSPRSTRR